MTFPPNRSNQPSTRKQQAAQRVRATALTRRIATQKEREKVRQMANIRAKKRRKAREYDEMKHRPISWSDEMKEIAKDKNNPLAGQYLWMDDPTAPGSAAWVEKGINKVLKIDPSKKFEWEKWKTRGLPEKVSELGWEFVKGAANTVPAVMRVVSSGAYSASKLASAPPKRIAPTLSEATGKMVTTGIKEALENPAGFAGGMVGVTGIAGGIAKAAKGGIKGAGKLSGKKNLMVRVDTQKIPAGSKSKESMGKSQPGVKSAREVKGDIGKRPSEKKKETKFERSDNRKKREEQRKKKEEERRKQEERKKREEQRKKKEEERRKQEERKKRGEQRRKRKEERKKRGEKRKKREAKGKKLKKVRRPHQRIRKIVKRVKLPHGGTSTATQSRKTANRASPKSYRRKEVVNNLPWL